MTALVYIDFKRKEALFLDKLSWEALHTHLHVTVTHFSINLTLLYSIHYYIVYNIHNTLIDYLYMYVAKHIIQVLIIARLLMQWN